MIKALSLAVLMAANFAHASLQEPGSASPSEMQLAEKRAQVLMQVASNEGQSGFQRKLIYCVGSAMGNVVLKTASAHCRVDGEWHSFELNGLGTTGGLGLRGTVLVAEIAPGGSLNGIYRGVEFGLAFTVLGAHVGYLPKQSPADGSRIYFFGYQAGLMGDLSRTTLEIKDAGNN